jgi:hypothetical protein
MAILSIKDFPEELLVFLKVKAAQERATLKDIVIGMVSAMDGAPNEAKAKIPKPRGRRPRNFPVKP